MIKVYGSDKCPDCIEFKYNLDHNGITYDYVNITDNMPNLKEFLKYRDNNGVFDEVRKAGNVGIPAIVKEDGSITTDWEGWMKENGFAVEKINKGQVCGIDGKGC